MFCPKCGVENKDNAKFCYNCGNNLTHLANSNKRNNISLDSLTELQSQYVQKICWEAGTKFILNVEITAKQFYDDASLYDMSEKQVDEAFSEIQKRIRKIYKFIEVTFNRSKNFLVKEQDIFDYGKPLKLPEEIIQSLINKFKSDNRIEEKAEFYALLLDDYLDYETEIDITQYDKLSEKDKKLVTELFKQNIELINDSIKKGYDKVNGIDLEEEQVADIISAALSIGIEDEEYVIDIKEKYDDTYGITELKRERVANKFYEFENQKYGKDIKWFGEHKRLEGKFFLENDLANRLRTIETEAINDWNDLNEVQKQYLGIWRLLFPDMVMIP